MKVHCSMDGICRGSECTPAGFACPVKFGTPFKALAEHVFYTNYWCRYFPKSKATEEPTIVKGGQIALGVFC